MLSKAHIIEFLKIWNFSLKMFEVMEKDKILMQKIF